LIAQGTDPKTTQRRLRHKWSKTTMDIYARATDEADRKAAMAIGEAFGPRDRCAMDLRPEIEDHEEQVIQLPYQGESSGRWGTRTLDLSRVKAAL
jgi:hypothetical protein